MEWVAAAIQRVAHMGAWAPLAFIAAYVIASILLAPSFLLTFAAGALFGLWRGTILAYIGAVLGGSAVYWLASPLSGSRLLARLDRDQRLAAVKSAVVGDAVWVMFLLRLSPIVPFVLLNYALAVTGVRYRDFVIASTGMLPTIVLYVYYGKVVGDVARIAAGMSPPRGVEYYLLLAIGLVATVVATTTITRAARRAMERQRRQPIDAGSE